MGSFASERRTFFYNLKRYGLTLSKDEIRQSLITIFIIAFIWSFDKWGSTTFDFVEGIKNFLIGVFFASVSLFLNQIGQRIYAVYYGYDPIYEYCMMGLMIGIIITFASRGLLIFFLPGGINLRHLSASRLGEFRYYTNDWEWAKIGFLGPFLNICFAVFLSFFKQYELVRQLIILNIMFAIYGILPFPNNLGLYLFYPHIFFWTFVLFFVISCSALIFLSFVLNFSPLLILVAGFIIGFIGMFWFYKKDGRW